MLQINGCVRKRNAYSYEGCSNMNASSFITFFTYMLQQNGNVSIKDYMSPLNWHLILRKTQYTYRVIAL